MNLDRLRKRVRQFIDQVRTHHFKVYVLQANSKLRSTKRAESLGLSFNFHNHNRNTGLKRVSPFYSNSTKVHCFGLTRQLLFLMVSETSCFFFAFSLVNAALQIFVHHKNGELAVQMFWQETCAF